MLGFYLRAGDACYVETSKCQSLRQKLQTSYTHMLELMSKEVKSYITKSSKLNIEKKPLSLSNAFS